jgi:hypothetical protein
MDAHYYEWPSKVYLHDNMYMNNGTMPDLASEIGIVLSTGTSAYPGGHVPDVLWDGIADLGWSCRGGGRDSLWSASVGFALSADAQPSWRSLDVSS